MPFSFIYSKCLSLCAQYLRPHFLSIHSALLCRRFGSCRFLSLFVLSNRFSYHIHSYHTLHMLLKQSFLCCNRIIFTSIHLNIAYDLTRLIHYRQSIIFFVIRTHTNRISKILDETNTIASMFFLNQLNPFPFQFNTSIQER